MSKVDYTDVPETGSVWDLNGVRVTVTEFKPHGKGGWVYWDTYSSVNEKTKWREFVKQAKAA